MTGYTGKRQNKVDNERHVPDRLPPAVEVPLKSYQSTDTSERRLGKKTICS